MNRPYTNDPASIKATILFGGWSFYSTVDRHYLEKNDLVTTTTGRVMLFECVLNFLAVGLSFARSRHAVLLAFTTTVMVLWKTIMFFSFYVGVPEGNWLPTNSNMGVYQTFMTFWVPNGFWVIVPSMVLIALWNKLALPPKIAENYWAAANKWRGDLEFEDVPGRSRE
uniref:Uncharacterized protein n=1 Tax=Caenorhabditis japonica TaxID=281687 RepID=A0A8R1HMX9_CAEJA